MNAPDILAAQAAPLTPAQKRTITRRANKAKREAFMAKHAAIRAAKETLEAAPPAAFSGSAWDALNYLQAKYCGDRYAAAVVGAQNRRNLRRQPLVRLADWRAAGRIHA